MENLLVMPPVEGQELLQGGSARGAKPRLLPSVSLAFLTHL